MGWVGWAFGNVTEKPGNIAAVAIVGAFFAIMFLSYVSPKTDGFPLRELLTLFGGIITTALGFLFGRSSQ